MTLAQRIAQVFGWAFILVGLAGFASTGASMEANHELAPRLFGLFPVNVLHNVVHLLFGVWGILAARSLGGARAYFIGAGVVYLLLAALGTVAPDGFGLVPIGGNDVGLHLFLALGLLASSFLARRRPAAEAAAPGVTTRR
jgi:hypothetical protein